MKRFSSQDARVNFALLLEDVLRGGHLEVTRYGRPIAAIVPHDWYVETKRRLEAGEGRGWMPVRLLADASPALASEDVIDLVPGHPLHGTACPACGESLTGPVLLVLAGASPRNRAPDAANGGAVAVHKACATGKA